MAENIKISDLSALSAARNETIIPVVDGGTTQKMSLSTLQTHLTASFATPSQLSTQISNVNSTISGLDTDDIDEGSTNLYYTQNRVDARILDLVQITASADVNALEIQNLTTAVLNVLNANDVLSGSIATSSINDFPTEVSRSAAAAGFSAAGVGGGDIPLGTVSSSAQITSLGFINQTVTSSMTVLSSSYALTASYALNAGGGVSSGSDYISGVSFSGTTLTFTGVGSAFNSTVDLSTGDLLDIADSLNYLNASTYFTDSSSFADRIDSVGGGGGGVSIPDGTVSSSTQIVEYNLFLEKNGDDIVSSSAQISLAQANKAGFTTDDIPTGSQNFYYTNSLVKSYLNAINVISGSIEAVVNLGGTGVVSASEQIEVLGFPTNATFGAATESLQNQIDGISSGVSVNDENVFLAAQTFTQGLTVTGSILLRNGSFSGSGANLFNIPATSIVGGLQLSGSTLADGTNSLVVDYSAGITATINTGSFNINGGNLIVASGSSFSGSGAGLFDIPGSAIIGGVGGGTSIATGSVTASVDPTLGLIVNSNISASGDITARSINVGTSGTPTIFSSTNLNLSASNAVVITDSPLRLTPFTNAQTASFTFSEGDVVYSADSDDFYGYRLVNGTGSLVSLTAGGSGDVTWASILGKPNGLISSSVQLEGLDTGFISSSAQFLSSSTGNQILFTDDLGTGFDYTSSLTYNPATNELTVGTVSMESLSLTGNLTITNSATASAPYITTTTAKISSLEIGTEYSFPTIDGGSGSVLKTNGSGVVEFGNINYSEIEGTPNVTGSINVEVNSVRVDTFVRLRTIDDSSIYETTGTIIVSASAGVTKPYFYDGTTWNALY